MPQGDNGNIDLGQLSDEQLMATYAKVVGIPGNLANRLNLANLMGSQYGGDRNIYSALGYPTDKLKFNDFYARYQRQDIAKAIIDKPVNATWRGSLTIREPGERDKRTKFEQQVKELSQDLDLKGWFSRLDKLTGLGHYGILLLGFDDVKDKDSFKRPVKQGKRQLHYVKAFGESSIEIHDWEKDSANPRYGMPVTYRLGVEGPEENNEVQYIMVHHTRVIHVTDGALESDIIGQPRLEPVFNRLMDLEKLVGGDAEMFWRGARPGYTGDVKENFNLTKEQRDKIEAQLKEYEHNLRRFIVTEGMNINDLQQQISDPANHVDVQIQMIAAEKGIPKRILVGSERGELASSEDRTQWLSEIKTRREEFAEAKVVRPFINKCLEYNVLSNPDTDEYNIVWEDLFAPSQQEKAEVGNTRAEALYFYTRQPFATEVMPLRPFLKYCWGLEENEADDIMQSSSDELVEEMKKIAEQGREESAKKEEKQNKQK